MAHVTVPGACGYANVPGVNDRGTRTIERMIANEMHTTWRHLFDNWSDIGQHGSDAFPLREGYVGPEAPKTR